ncbi:MAG: hypothetical protein JWQ35_2605, partial [Bacteriovoracaceae bacterium]|nr:hypothetical protein [Bacteriovoracaceae bacterium]
MNKILLLIASSFFFTSHLFAQDKKADPAPTYEAFFKEAEHDPVFDLFVALLRAGINGSLTYEGLHHYKNTSPQLSLETAAGAMGLSILQATTLPRV